MPKNNFIEPLCQESSTDPKSPGYSILGLLAMPKDNCIEPSCQESSTDPKFHMFPKEPEYHSAKLVICKQV
jgi:hypothetical protein